MNTRAAVVFVALLVACGGGGATGTTTSSAPRRYALHGSWIDPVGSRWREHGHSVSETQRTIRTEAGVQLDDTRTREVSELVATYTASAPHERRLIVEQFTVDSGSGPVAPPIPGPLVVTRDGITFDGAPIDPDLASQLRVLVQRIRGSGGTAHGAPSGASALGQTPEDDTWGMDEPRTIGESWPIEPTAAAHMLTSSGMAVQASNVSGEVRFAGVDRLRGEEVFVTQVAIAAHQIGLPNMPSTMEARRADARLDMELILPTRAGAPPLRTSTQVVMELATRVTVPQGSALVDLSMRVQSVVDRLPVDAP